MGRNAEYRPGNLWGPSASISGAGLLRTLPVQVGDDRKDPLMRRILLLAGALVLFASGIAIGQTPTDTFTGCLTPGGDLKNVAVGDTPTGDCKGNPLR